MRDSAPPDNRLLAAIAGGCVVGTVAFAVYTQTLLPGVDLGDTGGLQAAVLWPETSARRSYPLYYALAKPFVASLTPANPARGLNLFSALAGGLAIGLLTVVASLLVRSLVAGVVAGVTLAFSYTFWTQAVIAEVYTLHLLLIGTCLIALYGYSVKPTFGRLLVFFAIYALSFGHHLGMILFVAPFAIFLVFVAPRTELLTPKVTVVAILIAVAGALQYAPNLVWTWTSVDAPARWLDRIAAFWIDTTKADWRESMVFGVGPSHVPDRAAMWWWDAQQQFGFVGIIAAIAGGIRLWWISKPWAVLIWLAYAISTAFALTYNVGDTHVFFLPSHFLTALVVAAAVAPWQKNRLVPVALSIGLLAYAGWRVWDTYPAADRHLDRRADTLVGRLVTGIDERRSVLLSRMNWEPENALLYSARYDRRNLAWVRLPEVLPHLPYLVRDNHTIGRDVILTMEAAADVATAFGASFPIARDEPAAPSLIETVRSIPKGFPYVLAYLQPLREERFSGDDFRSVLATLTGTSIDVSTARYELWAGLSGEDPAWHHASDRPFRTGFSILGDTFLARMDSWLPTDTFRRGGFGHVLRGRERVLFVERGISLVWFRPDGSPATAYAAGVYAPEPRFRIPATTTLLAQR